MQRALLAAWIVLGIGWPALAAPGDGSGIVYVDDDAAPDGDGTTWPTAFRFLQDGITAASALASGVVEIRIGQGTYQPDRSEIAPDGTGDRDASFVLPAAVAIRGGYAGLAGPDPDDRDLKLYETRLSGDLQGNDLPDFMNVEDNSAHVARATIGSAEATLDGLTIVGGADDGEPGAGMQIESDIMLVDCRVMFNIGDSGGGVFVDAASPHFLRCHFEGNTAERAGAIYNVGGASLIEACVFIGNRSTEEFVGGGAIWDAAGERVGATITDCHFEANTAAWLGAGVLVTSATTLIEDCVFRLNEANAAGGLNCNTGSDVTVRRCRFESNTVNTIAGAVCVSFGGIGKFEDCLMVGNECGADGCGVYVGNNAIATLERCTIAGNVAAGVGGGVRAINAGSVTARNCIVWGNSDGDGSGEPSQFSIERSPLTVAFSCVEGLTGALGGAGNIGDDPLLVDDVHLAETSPCINAGDPATDPGPDATDIDGDPRVRQCRVDIGADETAWFVDCNDNGGSDACDIQDGGSDDIDGNGVPDECECPADVADPPDGDVGVADLVQLILSWGQPDSAADINGDGTVDVVDLILLFQSWGPCPVP